MTFPPLHLTVNKSPSAVKSTSKNRYCFSSLFCLPLVSTLFQGLYHPHLKVLLATTRNLTHILQSQFLNKYSWKERSLKSVAR